MPRHRPAGAGHLILSPPEGGTYGAINNFAATIDEEGNIIVSACIDRIP